MQPRPLPDGFLAVLMKRSDTLRNLNLDFWELSYDRLRTVFEVLPGLQRLQILLDAPFTKLVRNFDLFECLNTTADTYH